MPFLYGKYSFSVKSIEVIEAGSVVSNILPQSLILGLFTWDATEIYAIRENYNHEVDIEISRWNIPDNADAQFLVQPPGSPQMKRFFTGNPYQQAPHVYDFDWKPALVEWRTDAGGGETHRYSTEDALALDAPDFVQCLPADMEVRLNLWNLFGSATPVGMTINQVVEVVIDNFAYTPSSLTEVSPGGTCSKDCQCGSSQCQSNTCGNSDLQSSTGEGVSALQQADTPAAPSSSGILASSIVVGVILVVAVVSLALRRRKGLTLLLRKDDATVDSDVVGMDVNLDHEMDVVSGLECFETSLKSTSKVSCS